MITSSPSRENISDFFEITDNIVVTKFYKTLLRILWKQMKLLRVAKDYCVLGNAHLKGIEKSIKV